MSAKKQTRHKIFSLPGSDFQRLSRRFMSGFLRSLFLVNKSARYSKAGFVLPTTVLLLLITTLTVGALSYRTASRTESAYLAREQQVIDNIATPATDRAKAKLEYLFGRDARLPSSSTPSSDLLIALMANVTEPSLGVTTLGKPDPYELPGEERIDINGDGTVDNAWMFTFDLNGDGKEDQSEIVAYSILMDDAVDINSTPNDREDDIKIEDEVSREKASALVTRNGPINAEQAPAACGGSRVPSQGWYQVSSAQLEKNFQVTAYVSNGKDLGRANSALELQQVRRASRGNRWGAWFKYDLEISPGPVFKFNGAIHSDGNLMVDRQAQLHMISSHNSCLYTRESSAITLAEADNDGDGDYEPASGDFVGQLVVGNTTSNVVDRDRNNPTIHIFDGARKPLINTRDTRLSVKTDSVDAKRNVSPSNIALDPLALFTEDLKKHRRTDTWTRDADWESGKYYTEGRVTNQRQDPPYLDDFYRADNRYGPRPSYADGNWVTGTDKKLGETILATDPNGENLIDETSGLDGYWEKQAGVHGLRLVVGQRLELGNTYGWRGDRDPLYPPNSTTISNLQRQRRTLRDNLAAVQGMVVYHYESNGGSYPLACYAATSHPGTFETLQNSRTFINWEDELESGTGTTLKADFLSGNGSNGWEFQFPSAFDTESKFATQLANDQPLGIALRNLARFAGDPEGGSPSFTPVQDSLVHPAPYMSMWGDFSILRRIFDEYLDNGVTYTNLSVADKSTLHSATCTMGLLAYNLEKAIDIQSRALSEDSLVSIGNTIYGLVNTEGESYDQRTLKEWLAEVSKNEDADEAKQLLEGAIAYVYAEQIRRDRALGFIDRGLSSRGETSENVIWNAETGEIKLQSSGSTATFRTNCDPNIFRSRLPDSEDRDKQTVGLAIGLCSGITGPKYPSLYYLFPLFNHDQDGDDDTGEDGVLARGTVGFNHKQSTPDSAEEYVTDKQINAINPPVTGPVTSSDIIYGAISDLEAIALVPQSATNFADWKLLPASAASTSDRFNPESMDIVVPNGELLSLPLLEKGMYNGREEMTVRVLDVDLGRLTQETNPDGSDYWVSDGEDSYSGIIYAAREDAVREDSIVRPAVGNWTDCDQLANIANFTQNSMSPSCRMNVSSATPTDPPLTKRRDGSDVGISIKPINYAPDPDRRPYGFRLNADLNNNKGDISNNRQRKKGVSFITDNAAYIKGNFNPHSTNGNDSIEEFTQNLFVPNSNVDFYDDRTVAGRNLDKFAVDSIDRWRVAEILADAVTILSNSFVDGAIEEGFVNDQGERSSDFNNSVTSFHNQQRPLRNNNVDKWAGVDGWLREDLDTPHESDAPIWVGRNGESKTADNTIEEATDDSDFVLRKDYTSSDLEGMLITENIPHRVNATMISGLVPSREKQTYGGLHNFPRFLQRWQNGNNNTDLFIQGAFLQLNFSTASTAPFSISAWEPDEFSDRTNDRIPYYSPPERSWGYDVALQYAPAGPIAQRFVTIERPRSESYRELPIDDPYVKGLRCAKMPNGNGTTLVLVFSDEATNCPSEP